MVFRGSSLYQKQLCLFCLLRLISASADKADQRKRLLRLISASAAHFLCTTACIRRDISAASFGNCKLLWRSNECVFLPCFNAQPDIFAVMNCCVVALSLFSSDILAWSTDSLCSVQWHIKYWECVYKNMHIMLKNFAKTLVLKHEYDVKLWRHKQRTPNTNAPCATE